MTAKAAAGLEPRLSGGNPGRVRTGRTRIVLLAVFGLLLAVLSPLVIAGSAASAATAVWGTPTQIPSPPTDKGATFTSVSCSDPLDCTAVGYTGQSVNYETDGYEGTQPIAVTETGGVWGNPELQPVGELASEQWNSVSCTSAGNCVAVGESRCGCASGAGGPLYANETNGVWSPVEGFSGTTGSQSSMNSVSCPSLGNCVAVGQVGYAEFSGPSSAAGAVETNGVWGPDTPDIGDTASATAPLVGVSCVAVGFCYAVGQDMFNQPYVTVYESGTWGNVKVISPVENSVVTGISCSPSNVCTAVGNGTYWVGTDNVWDTYSFGIFAMSAVSCTDATDCTAVGSGGYATETAGVWGAPTAFAGFPVGPSSVNGVSCTDATDCTAVGYDGGTLYVDAQPFYVTSQPKTDQTPLTVTSTSGVYGTPLALTTSGGSGTGAVSYIVTNGTASGCALFYAALTSTSAGTCIVTATKAGDADYNPTSSAPTTVTFSRANQAPLTLTSTNGGSGTPLPLTFSGGSGTGAVSYAVTDGTATGCLIALDSTLNATSAGTCIVVVTKAGDATYNAASSSPTTVTFSAPPPPAPTPTPTPTPPPVVTSPTTTPNHGYWLVGSDGGIFTFGSAQFYGSTGNLHLQRPVVGITPTEGDLGYWLVASDGGIFSFGNAGFYGSIPGLGIAPAGSGLPHSLNAPIVGMVPSSDGNGYFMVGADGGVFTFGDAKFEGSCPSIGGCAGGAAVAVMPDATGNGYWVVTAGGDVQPFGDAAAYGGPGPVGGPVVAAVRTPDGGGYYVLFGGGEVFAFGDAVYRGGAYGEVGGYDPASTIFTTADNGGYWIVSANGSVITEGDAPYEGGANELHLNGAIIAGTGW